MTRVQKFVVVFIGAYFLFVFTFMSRYDIDKPLPVPVRFVPLSLFVAAIAVVAILSRTPRVQTLPTSATAPRVSWLLKTIVVVYGFSLVAGIGLVLAGKIPLRVAVPGLVVNAALMSFLYWLVRQTRR